MQLTWWSNCQYYFIATSNIADAITRNGAQQQRARNCLANVETFENSIYHVVRPMGGCAPSQRGGHAPRQEWCLRLNYKFWSSITVITKRQSESIMYTLYFYTDKVWLVTKKSCQFEKNCFFYFQLEKYVFVPQVFNFWLASLIFPSVVHWWICNSVIFPELQKKRIVTK